MKVKNIIFVWVFLGSLVLISGVVGSWIYQYPEMVFEPKNLFPLQSVYLSAGAVQQGGVLLIQTKNRPVKAEFGGKEINFFQASGSGAWTGLLAIDAKKEPGENKLIIDLAEEGTIEKDVDVIKKDFPTTKLLLNSELKNQGYSVSNIVKNINNNEAPLVNKILSGFTPVAYFSRSFVYPLDHIKNVGAFGNIRKSGNTGFQHLGVDLEAALDTPVSATNDGVVRLTQKLPTYGNTVIIDHGLGIYSLYLHLNEFKVKEGDFVQRGQILGLSGNTGYSLAPHLHFSIKANGESVDALQFIKTSVLMAKEMK